MQLQVPPRQNIGTFPLVLSLCASQSWLAIGPCVRTRTHKPSTSSKDDSVYQAAHRGRCIFLSVFLLPLERKKERKKAGLWSLARGKEKPSNATSRTSMILHIVVRLLVCLPVFSLLFFVGFLFRLSFLQCSLGLEGSKSRQADTKDTKQAFIHFLLLNGGQSSE